MDRKTLAVHSPYIVNTCQVLVNFMLLHYSALGNITVPSLTSVPVVRANVDITSYETGIHLIKAMLANLFYIDEFGNISVNSSFVCLCVMLSLI